MTLEKRLKVRVEYDQDKLTREEALKLLQESNFSIIPLRHSSGIFAEYLGCSEQYKAAEQGLASQGLRLVYRESRKCGEKEGKCDENEV